MTTTTTSTRRTTRHELKLWTDQFIAMQLGAKRADVRRCDDREFRRGDEVLYRDFTARTGEYSGMAMLVRITHLTRAAGTLDLYGALNEGGTTDGLSFPIVVLSIEVLELGAYEALKTTAPGELPGDPRVAVGPPSSSSTPPAPLNQEAADPGNPVLQAADAFNRRELARAARSGKKRRAGKP
jgi:hypothetical protein